jgi:single-strand DNA-binding protein
VNPINTVTVVGNLTRDPEVKFQVAGQAKLVLAVAVTRRWQDPATSQAQEATSFLDVVCWGDLAQNVSRSAKRGSRVVITGRVEQRTWKSKGVPKSKTEIVADDVALSLRWATGSVIKAERTTVDDDGAAQSENSETPAGADGGGQAEMDYATGPGGEPEPWLAAAN